MCSMKNVSIDRSYWVWQLLFIFLILEKQIHAKMAL